MLQQLELCVFRRIGFGWCAFFIFIPFCAQAPLCKGSWRPNGRLRGCYNNPSASCLGTSLYTREAVTTEIGVSKSASEVVFGDAFLRKRGRKDARLRKNVFRAIRWSDRHMRCIAPQRYEFLRSLDMCFALDMSDDSICC